MSARLTARTWSLAASALLATLLAAPAMAQSGSALYTTPGSPSDRVHYTPTVGIAGASWTGSDQLSGQATIGRLAAFGVCVVARDPAGSAAYIRSSVMPGGEATAFHALGVARGCERLSRADRELLGNPAIRQSSIADALRVRLAR